LKTAAAMAAVNLLAKLAKSGRFGWRFWRNLWPFGGWLGWICGKRGGGMSVAKFANKQSPVVSYQPPVKGHSNPRTAHRIDQYKTDGKAMGYILEEHFVTLARGWR